MNKENKVEISQDEKRRSAQKARNTAIGLCLAAFVVIVYIVSVTKLGANIMNRPL